ncbi:MAG: hypothetical protein MUC31_04210 [Bacteroidales bacterium]|nr:hypothetical protein [Bacteroidales bacterium]
MDFTLKTYRNLLGALIARGYAFQTFAEFLEQPAPRCIILRHDVEARYGNALAIAQIQHRLGIRGSYYFRFLPNHFSTDIIRQIAEMGHETGYHYDDLSHCKGDYDAAIRRFEKNLATLREIAEVKTICMEGAPLSKWDNRDLWSKHQIPNSKFQTNSKTQIVKSQEPESRNPHHYSDYGIIGEPYFDIDFSKVLYLTDTGRRWDGEKVSVRDKVVSQPHLLNPLPPFSPSPKWRGGQGVRLHNTNDIIAAADNGLLPDQVMITIHPQRWTDQPLPWAKELVMQNLKNVVKRIMLNVKF